MPKQRFGCWNVASVVSPAHSGVRWIRGCRTDRLVGLQYPSRQDIVDWKALLAVHNAWSWEMAHDRQLHHATAATCSQWHRDMSRTQCFYDEETQAMVYKQRAASMLPRTVNSISRPQRMLSKAWLLRGLSRSFLIESESRQARPFLPHAELASIQTVSD